MAEADGLLAAHARLHALSWLVKQQQTMCDDLQHRLLSRSGGAAEPAKKKDQSAEAHLQSALHSLAACALALSDRAEPERDEAREIRALTRRVADALDACATLSQAGARFGSSSRGCGWPSGCSP